jgi:hypothetical protein
MEDMNSQWLYGLKGKEVVFTGSFKTQDEREHGKLAERLGASRISDDCNLTTNVLVRGFSPRWKFGDFGTKERKVADMQVAGRDVVIIDEAGLLGLVDDIPAPVLPPHSPSAPARAPADQGGSVGAPYRRPDHDPSVAGDGEVFRDPKQLERAFRAHASTLDALANLIRSKGYEPLVPQDATCNFDLAWTTSDGHVCVAEVKSNTIDNESLQVRHGLGQVLDYAHRLQQRGFRVQPLLVLERQPEAFEHWRSLCQANGVVFAWVANLENLVV